LGGILEMNKTIEKIEKRIVELLDEDTSRRIPRRKIEKELSNQYRVEDVKKAISNLVENFTIDLVIDYPPIDSDLNTGHPHWFLKILSPDERQELHNLTPLQISLLRILQETDDEGFPGEVPISEAKAKLIARGFSKDEVEWITITDRVYQAKTNRDGVSVRCLMIIPEYEKTEEYKREEERIEEEFTRKEAFRMYITDVHELADGILKAVREAPEGISKKDIIEQLFMDDPKYLDHAFEIATEEDEILSIILDSGEEGYKYNPEYNEEN
jgi:hypothetical protein